MANSASKTLEPRDWRIYGIRHHSPSCARHLRTVLEEDPPDVILLECPVEAEPAFRWVAERGMEPPVALLVYRKDGPSRAMFLPFAEFSPEWQVLRFAAERGIPVRAFDLPLGVQFAEEEPESREEEREEAGGESSADQIELNFTSPDEPEPAAATGEAGAEAEHDPARALLRWDPLAAVAALSGYDDPEAWWDGFIERRRTSTGIFEEIEQLMATLREEPAGATFGGSTRSANRRQDLREAHMRKIMRQTARQGCENPAIICGAWHVPALRRKLPVKHDNALLKGLPKTRLQTTWIPWTYRYLASQSGYAAGITSPAYYEHLWTHPTAPAIPWLSQAARVMRGQDDAGGSSQDDGEDRLTNSPPPQTRGNGSTGVAQAVDAARLAGQLAGLRERQTPGLEELEDAALSVFAEGRSDALEPVRDRLVIGRRMGAVPEKIPAMPLQQDFRALCRRLRLKPQQEPQSLDLDLRKPIARERSLLLHRLGLLHVGWGRLGKENRRDQGSFHERWNLIWQPDFELQIIRAGRFGNTIRDAAMARVLEDLEATMDLAETVELLSRVLRADLPEVLEPLLKQLDTVSSVQGDMDGLLKAIPALVDVSRYGDVRQSPSARLPRVLQHICSRVMIGLAEATAGLAPEAAQKRTGLIINAGFALESLDRGTPAGAVWEHWIETLLRLLEMPGCPPFLAGRLARLLFQKNQIPADDVRRRLARALSPGLDPRETALWLGGFLHGSGLLLLHEPRFWQALDTWLRELPNHTFLQFLPLLRKAFSTINPVERRRLLQKSRSQGGAAEFHPGIPQSLPAEAEPLPGEWERARRPHAVLDLILPTEPEQRS